MQSIFRSASRRETLGKHSKGGRRDGGLKMLCTMSSETSAPHGSMELLQAVVDRPVIALWLGHESVETTQIYLDANLALKEQALARRRAWTERGTVVTDV
jgi:integrase